MMFLRFALALTLTGLVACEEKTPPGATPATPVSAEAAPSTAPQLFTTTRPANAANLASIKTTAQTGDTVTFLARVGGKRKTFIDGVAVFVVADPDLTSCELMGEEDHCRIPWDYCCEDNDALTAGLATIRLVDKDGAVLKTSAEGQGGLEPLKFIVVEGIVSDRNDDGLFVVDAGSIWVGGKPSRADRMGGSGG
ncbi:MAG: hypothetical protein HOO04_02335 [Phycisphaerae bacterium]|jgi:hypothetical protein|nr:hypothetical protein [Phycisphaerae bacterium]MBT5381917.1 hypothetical protein [Phycisphaerae bacterium]MBT5583210.1 hypothetical protein [Phycisphaerae bacterium]